MPDTSTVKEYALSVPGSFRFGVKLPNALTLTHYRHKRKTDPPVNPHFLSRELLHAFLDRLEPIHDKLGPFMFQFGYLNKQMMPPQVQLWLRATASLAPNGPQSRDSLPSV